VLKTLLVGPLRFTPLVDQGRKAYRFTGVIALDRLVAGVIELKTLTRVASPGGLDGLCTPIDHWFAELAPRTQSRSEGARLCECWLARAPAVVCRGTVSVTIAQFLRAPNL
jgi:hypothetical protein